MPSLRTIFIKKNVEINIAITVTILEYLALFLRLIYFTAFNINHNAYGMICHYLNMKDNKKRAKKRQLENRLKYGEFYKQVSKHDYVYKKENGDIVCQVSSNIILEKLVKN